MYIEDRYRWLPIAYDIGLINMDLDTLVDKYREKKTIAKNERKYPNRPTGQRWGVERPRAWVHHAGFPLTNEGKGVNPLGRGLPI